MKQFLMIIIIFFILIGVACAGITVTLQWNPNSEPDLAGYNIYRGLADGGPYVLLGSVPTGTEQYTDATVEYDKTYYYVVTAFDNEVPRSESGYSNQVSFFQETPPNLGPPEVPQDLDITVHIIINKGRNYEVDK